MYLNLKDKLENCQGFTLIQSIIIIAVLAIVIPPLIDLLSSNLIHSGKSEAITQAVIYGRDKMDEIIADKKSPARGYNWVVTPGQYASDVPANGFTRVVIIDTTAKVHNGVRYALIRVRINHNDMAELELRTWLTDY